MDGMSQREILRREFPMWALVLLAFACILPANGEPLAIDAAKSSMTVHVYKAGMLSAFGHDHEISAPVAHGSVDIEKRKVELQVSAGALRVVDPKVSDKDRAEIQKNMLGPEVLDAENHKEIEFRSTGAEAAGSGAWKLTGNLTLHGETRPVSMDVRERDGHYTGTCRFKITDFAIKPVKAAGGAIRVKDEVQIEFDIQLAR
jgi:polyisoprenoid-binding protein YceI